MSGVRLLAPRGLVVAGLAGAGAMASGAWTAGALPGEAPQGTAAALWGDDWWFRAGLAAYVLGLAVLSYAWWRTGARLSAGGAPVRRACAVGALWAAPLLLAPPVGSRDVYAYACQGAAWRGGHDPYAVGVEAAGCPWLSAVPELWHDTTAPYGPVGLVVAAAAVTVARLLADGDQATLLWTLVGLRVAAVGGVVLTAATLPGLARACGVDPARATWLGLATPLVGVHAVAGAHNDALVAGLVVAGLCAAAAGPARQPGEPYPAGGRWWVYAVVGGAALGVAAAVKVTALVVVPFAVLLVAGRGLAGWPRAAACVAAAGAGFAAPTVATGLGTGWAAALTDTGALGQWSAWPSGLGMAVGYVLEGLGLPWFDGAVAVAQAVALAVLAVVGAVLVWQAWQRRADRRAVVWRAGAAAVAVVILAPVFYPWYALVPLAVLAAAVVEWRVRWWLAVVTLAAAALTFPSGLGVPAVTKGPGAAVVGVATVVLAVWGLRWLARRPADRAAAGTRADAPRRALRPPPGPHGPAR